MKKSLLFLIIPLLLINFVYANSVTENQITIISDKDQYFCEPIFNEKGHCLIKAKLEIIYNRLDSKPIIISTNFSSNIEKVEFLNKVVSKEIFNIENGELPKEISKETIFEEKSDEYTTKPINVLTDDIVYIEVQFWADKNGKFDVNVNDGLVKTTLDPIYNITLNATTPTWWLQFGNPLDNINSFYAKTDVSAQLSDGNDNTAYPINLGTPLQFNYMRYYYQFNNIYSGTIIHDIKNNHHLTKYPNAQILSGIDYYMLNFSNSLSSGAKAIYNPDFNIPATNFTYCININSTQVLTTTDSYIFSVDDTTNPKYGIYIDLYSGNNRAVCEVRDDNDGTDREATTIYNITDGVVHYICCRRNINSGIMEIIVDGVSKANVSNVDSTITNYADLVINGLADVGVNGLNGAVDEFALWTKYLTDDELANNIFYNSSSAYVLQPFFNYTFQFNKSYSLKIIVNNSEFPIRIWNMVNETDVGTQYVEQVLSNGINYIDITSITGTNYSNPLRIVPLHSHNISISEISLIESANDSIAPTIAECFVNDSFVDCDDSVEWGCTIYDNESDVNLAFGRVNFGGFFPFTKQAFRDPLNLTRWSVKLNAQEIFLLLESMGWGFNETTNVYLYYVNATDLAGNKAENFTSKPSNVYGCILGCEPDWQPFYESCLINDSQLKYYIDMNNCYNESSIPSDNNTYVYCNYCSENLQKNYTTDCYVLNNDTIRNFIWIDNNFYSCCAITNLTSDCSILYEPYNTTNNSESCILLENDFYVDYDTSCNFEISNNDKCFWIITINDTNNTYNCISYIKTIDGLLLQTNPVYTKQSDTLIKLQSTNYDDRQTFITENGIATVYFTKENLLFDNREHIFGVKCSGNNKILSSERLVTVGYADINAPATRTLWASENMDQFILFTLMSIIVIVIVFFIAWVVIK